MIQHEYDDIPRHARRADRPGIRATQQLPCAYIEYGVGCAAAGACVIQNLCLCVFMVSHVLRGICRHVKTWISIPHVTSH